MYIYTSGHEEVSFILNSMPPISKTKTKKGCHQHQAWHQWRNDHVNLQTWEFVMSDYLLMMMILFQILVKKLFLSWWKMIINLSAKTRKRRGYNIGGTQLTLFTESLCVRQWLSALHIVSVDMYQKIYWSQNLKIGVQAFVKCAWILNWKLRDWRAQMLQLIGFSP